MYLCSKKKIIVTLIFKKIYNFFYRSSVKTAPIANVPLTSDRARVARFFLTQ
jgi:hypothetical protein